MNSGCWRGSCGRGKRLSAHFWVLEVLPLGSKSRHRAGRQSLKFSAYFQVMTRIIVLNGVGSVGKTSTARALQELACEPFLHVQGDAFLDMIPSKMWGHGDGISFEQQDKNGLISIEIVMGDFLNRLMRGMRSSICALAKAGNSCLVDDVMLCSDDQRAYMAEAAFTPLQFVGLHAPLAVLERRERERGDRLLGLARWQYERVHRGINYDFEIDTVGRSPIDCAEAIASALNIPITQ